MYYRNTAELQAAAHRFAARHNIEVGFTPPNPLMSVEAHISNLTTSGQGTEGRDEGRRLERLWSRIVKRIEQ